MRSSTSEWCCSTSVLPLRWSCSVIDSGPDAPASDPGQWWVIVAVMRSGLLGLPEDLGDLVDLREQVVGCLGVHGALGPGGAGQLGGLVDQRVQLRVLLEVRRLE